MAVIISLGSDKDITNFEISDKALHINSCGINRTLGDTIIIDRPLGRRDYQLMYMTVGKAEHEVEGILHTVKAGHAVLYAPGDAQKYIYKENIPVRCHWVHFSGSYANELLDKCGLVSGIMEIGESDEIALIFDRLIRESRDSLPGYEELLPALLQEIIVLMGRNLMIHKDKGVYKKRERLMSAVESMHINYMTGKTIEEYASLCSMSKYHFTHTFKEIMGISPKDYLSAIRIERAKELLASSSLSIGRIGALCGYENPLYFSRFFSSHVGIPPIEYRSNGK